MVKQYEKTERDLQALQSVGQIIGDVLKTLNLEGGDDADKVKFIVKASSGMFY